MNKTKVVCIRVDEETWKRLYGIALDHDITVSDLLRRLIEIAIVTHEAHFVAKVLKEGRRG